MSSIEHVSPGNVAQCRLIHLDGQRHLTYQCLLSAWLSTLPPALNFLEPLLSFLLPVVLDFVAGLDKRVQTATGFHRVKAVKQLLTVVRTLTDCAVAEATGGKTSGKQTVLDAEVRAWIQACALFAILWTLAVPAFVQVHIS